MDAFDVVIVGVGPAGAAAARLLSHAGFKVLMLEKELSFSANDFSSGGAPLEILNDFQLPETVVGAYCRQIRISATQESHVWQDENPVALVLDFKKLRTFLAEEALRKDATLFFGCAYRSHRREGA
ncbi:MAG: FAD-dependent monooxygenase, partial [Nitrospirota bacterium]|nr:FAD-dependent monooxygenase [Nitrospirota bacterium]